MNPQPHKAKVKRHGHSATIPDEEKIINDLVRWEEVKEISLGSIAFHRASSTSDNKVRLNVVDWEYARSDPPVKTGIVCQIRKGSTFRLITVRSNDLRRLAQRMLGDPTIKARNLLRDMGDI